MAISAAALVVGFGGGFLAVGKVADFGWFGGKSAVTAQAPKGEAWSLFGKPRSANAPRRGIPKPEGFAVWRSRIDSSGAEPMACVQMSKPLDASKAYADYVLISPDLGRQPAVRVKDDELCIGGVGFTDHRVTLLKGLPGKNGETLAANADVDFTFGEKPPYVGFAGDGVILPREESDGVALETMNVSKPGHRGLARVGPQPGAQVDQRPRPDRRGRLFQRLWRRQPRRRGPPGLEGRDRRAAARPARRPRPSSRWARCSRR